uniref:Putative ovule protein n=1 Tax=Solanum chacoense TaxID=4108 RepID=A0A0V0GMP7_SOLCH
MWYVNNQCGGVLLVTNSIFLHPFWWFVPSLTLQIHFLMYLNMCSHYIFAEWMHALHMSET